ncbi:ABC transporter substrate-binding protein [Inhella sp.]|uniref:ABC transporter substrate-binding protein n=1 Tax=Inhella sp. TaxID=1921806 RepID=UPI0035ADC45A
MAIKRRHILQGLGSLVSLAACAPPQRPLRLGSIVFPGYEPLFLARELGWLAPERVRLVELMSNTDTLRALAVGHLDAAQLTLDEFLTAVHDGVEMRIVNVLDLSEGADAVMAHPQLPVGAPLAGKRIAVEESAAGAVMLASFLHAQQLQPEQLKRVPSTLVESVDLLRRGEVDLVVSAEPWITQLEAQGARRLFDSRAIPWRIVDVLAVRSDALPQHAGHLAAALKAHFDALAHWQRQPEDAARRTAARLQLAPEQVPHALRGLRQPDAATARRWLSPGSPLLERALALQAVMLKAGLLQQPRELADLFDTRFLPT